MSGRDIMLPKLDVAFKMLFGDQRNIAILRRFLMSVLDLDPDEYESMTLVDPHLKAEDLEDKTSVVDVNLTTKAGKTIHIEMQIADKKNMRQRMVFLNAKLLAAQLGRSEGYERLKRVISIVIADFDLIPEIQDGYHHVFELLEKRTGTRFSDLIEINALELPKIPLQSDATEAYDWLCFLRAERKEEFEMVAARNAAVEEAYVELKRLSEDENNQLIYEARLKRIRDEQAERALAYDQGVARGIQQGIEQGIEQGVAQGIQQNRVEIALEMLREGEDVNRIARYTGLTPSEIEKLA